MLEAWPGPALDDATGVVVALVEAGPLPAGDADAGGGVLGAVGACLRLPLLPLPRSAADVAAAAPPFPPLAGVGRRVLAAMAAAEPLFPLLVPALLARSCFAGAPASPDADAVAALADGRAMRLSELVRTVAMTLRLGSVALPLSARYWELSCAPDSAKLSSPPTTSQSDSNESRGRLPDAGVWRVPTLTFDATEPLHAPPWRQRQSSGSSVMNE